MKLLSRFKRNDNITMVYVQTDSDYETIIPKNIVSMELCADGNKNPVMQVIEQSRRGGTRVTLFPLSHGWQLLNSNEFLRSLNTGLDIKFNSFRQYNELIEQCFELITRG